MIKEKYIQLCLAHQFGGINTIEVTQSLGARQGAAYKKWETYYNGIYKKKY